MPVLRKEHGEVSITHQQLLSGNASLFMESGILISIVCLSLFQVLQRQAANLLATLQEILDIYPLAMGLRSEKSGDGSLITFKMADG